MLSGRLAMLEELLSSAQLADDRLGDVALAIRGASRGHVLTVGKLSSGLVQFLESNVMLASDSSEWRTSLH